MVRTFGKHSVKYGVQSTRMQNNAFVGNNSRGTLGFTAPMPGRPPAMRWPTPCLGLPATHREPNEYALKNLVTFLAAYYSGCLSHDTQPYAQFRFEMGRHYTAHRQLPVNGRFATPQPADRSFTVRTDIPKTAYPYYNKAFAPRPGFFMSPFGNQKTIVRGGAGLYYNSPVAVNGFLDLIYEYPERKRKALPPARPTLFPLPIRLWAPGDIRGGRRFPIVPAGLNRPVELRCPATARFEPYAGRELSGDEKQHSEHDQPQSAGPLHRYRG